MHSPGSVRLDERAFWDRWSAWYPGALPVAHLLREAHGQRWVRVHSLPAATRYPETDDEWRELLRRQNQVATDILGAGSVCTVIAPAYGSEVAAVLAARERLGLRLIAVVREDFPAVGEPEDYAMDLYGGAVTWRAGAFDDVLRLRAGDVFGPVAFVGAASGRVFAPYDGGIDLFFASSAERNAARLRYRAWLSPDPSGL
jgi:hypothetical protein